VSAPLAVLDSAAVNAPVGVRSITPAASATVPSPSRRIALVIGMSAYAGVAPLRNPASDARVPPKRTGRKRSEGWSTARSRRSWCAR
jgi:hypothetical protein